MKTKQICPICNAHRSDIKILNEAQMIERNKAKLKNHWCHGDIYEAFKNDKNITIVSKCEVLGDLQEGNKSYCGQTQDMMYYVYHR